MREQGGIFKNLDPLLVALYLIMVLMGWLNIYASVFNEEHQSIIDFTQKYGKQLIWIGTALLLAIIILILDGNFYAAFSYPIYGISIISLILVLFIGKEISGSKSWFRLGELGIQPAEFAKFATNMALAKYLSNVNIKMTDMRTKIISAVLIIVPILLIIVENETGCALVFFAFILVLYREGLSGNILLLGSAAAILFVLALLINKFILIGIIAGIALFLLLIVRRNRQNLAIIFGALIFSSAFLLSVISLVTPKCTVSPFSMMGTACVSIHRLPPFSPIISNFNF